VLRPGAASILALAAMAPAAAQAPRPLFDVNISTSIASDRVVSPDEQRLLIELWVRHVTDRGAKTYESEDLALLERMRDAEKLGAFDLLRDKLGGLGRYAVEHRVGSERVLWLTKEGFNRYVFLKSQTALKYFEKRGTPAKFIFQIRTMEGKRIFDPTGTLTPQGEALYNQILRRRVVQWHGANGDLMSNGRLPPPAAPH